MLFAVPKLFAVLGLFQVPGHYAVPMLFAVPTLFKVTVTKVEEPIVDVGMVNADVILQWRGCFLLSETVFQTKPPPPPPTHPP